MNECNIERIECPRCHQEGQMKKWEVIDVVSDFELKEKLFDNDLYRWRCECCGKEMMVPYRTLYYDRTHGFILLFSPWEDDELKYKPVEIPVLKEKAFVYIARLVYGVKRLREKISILEEGLNDVAIERMKFFLRLDGENNISGNDQLFFWGVDTDQDKIATSGLERGSIRFLCFREKKEPEILTYPMELYYDYVLAIETDPRMKVEQCTCIDEGWINSKLQSM